MKQFFVPLLAALASGAGQPQTSPPQRLSELRLAVVQSQSLSQRREAVAVPRRLTAAEAAELRRQVRQQSHRAARS